MELIVGSEIFFNFAKTHAEGLSRAKARWEYKIKGVYSRFILVGRKPGSLRTTVKNTAKWTLTGMYMPIRLILCLYRHGMSVGYSPYRREYLCCYLTVMVLPGSLSEELQRYRYPRFFFINPSQWGIGDNDN